MLCKALYFVAIAVYDISWLMKELFCIFYVQYAGNPSFIWFMCGKVLKLVVQN